MPCIAGLEQDIRRRGPPVHWSKTDWVRVLSQPSYPSGRRSPAEVIGILESLKFNHAGVHETLADDVSLSNPEIFAQEFLAGPKQVTDTYLNGSCQNPRPAHGEFRPLTELASGFGARLSH